MTTRPNLRKRKADMAARVRSDAEDHFARCTVLGCGRPTMRAARIGLAADMCQYHVQRKARFGSAFAPPIRGVDLRPYTKTAQAWIESRWFDPLIVAAIADLEAVYYKVGRGEPAMNLRGRSAEFRAWAAFARLRDTGVPTDRLLAAHLAVAAIIEDDRDAHRIREFRIVSTAKAVHRLASGTHRKWDFPLPDGTTAPLEMHVYPRSSGQVLRVIGEELEACCASVTERDRDAVRQLKREKFGPHPSQEPGWKPAWQRKRDAAA